MSIFETNNEKGYAVSQIPQDCEEWPDLYKDSGHHQRYQNVELPLVIDCSLGGNPYYNAEAYAGGTGAFNPSLGSVGDNYGGVTVGGNALACRGYVDNDGVTVGYNNLAPGAYKDNSLVYNGSADGRYANSVASDYDSARQEKIEGEKKHDKYADVPIDQLPDDGTATRELNRRELASMQTENQIAKQQYQAGMSRQRWLQSGYRGCYADNQQVAQSTDHGNQYWWQRNW